MLTALTNLLDQNRAMELVDFILIFAILLALAMLILFLLAVSRNRRLQKEIRESSSELYYFLLPTLALDGRDHQLIKQLAEFLPIPQQKHRIMVNPRIFDFCARRLLAAKPEQQDAIAVLRSKLGFPQGAEDVLPVSTRDLPLDLPVILVRKGNPPLRGTLVAKDESSLSVEIQGEADGGPAAGQASGLASGPASDPAFDLSAGPAAIPVSVYFQSRAGFFSFPTRITAREQQVIRLDHSDRIKRYQRRRYTRRQLRLPVFIHPYGGTSKPLNSDLIELSGGGASLHNPSRAFTIDQQVELSFAPGGEKFHVLGRIVRMSKGGRVVHVEFQALEETERERIGRLAMKR